MGKSDRNGLGRRQQQQQRKNQQQGSTARPKTEFAGLSQDALKGIVTCDSMTGTSLAQQFNAFNDALIRVAGSTEKCGAMLKTSIKKGRMMTKRDDFCPEEPDESTHSDADGSVDKIKKEANHTAWVNACTAQEKPCLICKSAMDNLFNIIVGQLGPSIASGLEAIDEWDEIDEQNRTTDLLKHPKEPCHRGDVKKSDIGIDIIRKAKEFFAHRQTNEFVSTLDHVEEATNKMDVLKSKGMLIISRELVKCTLSSVIKDGTTCDDHCDLWSSTSDASIRKKEKIEDAMREVLPSRAIIEGLNEDACRGLKQDVEDEHARGAHREVDNHTNTVSATVALANQCHVKITPKHDNGNRDQNNDQSNKKQDDNEQSRPDQQDNKDGQTTKPNESKPQDDKITSGQALQLLMRGGDGDDDTDDEFILFQRCVVDDCSNGKHQQNPDISDHTDKHNEHNSSHLNDTKDADIINILKNDFGIVRDVVCEPSSDVSGRGKSRACACNEEKLGENLCTSATQNRVEFPTCEISKDFKRSSRNTAESHSESMLIPTLKRSSRNNAESHDPNALIPNSKVSPATRRESIESISHNAESNALREDDLTMAAFAAIPRPTSLSSTKEMHHTNACLFSQSAGRDMNPWWLLPDSQASVNVICNPRLVTNVRKHPEGRDVRLHCNAGWRDVDTIADMEGCGTVWFCADGIANCPSLARVSDSHRITLDTSVDQAFHLHGDDGATRRFQRTACNPCACNVKKREAVSLIITVDGKKKNCSDLDVRRATAARKLQETVGFPSTPEFLKMIDNNAIKNCPATRRDVLMGEDICGANPDMVKGKTVWRKPSHVSEDVLPVPPDILKRHRNVALSVDAFHINGCAFLRTISRHLMFRSSIAMNNVKQERLMKNVQKIVHQCGLRGFKVTQIHGDNQFNCSSDDLAKPPLNITFHPVARNSHEPFIERDNRTNEDRCRCTCATLQFKWIPKRMTMELPPANDFWLNHWCSSGGVSSTVPPRQIITGIQLDARKHCRFQCGECVLAHEDTDDTMKERAIDAIHLRPTGTPDGAFYVLNIATGQRVRRRSATPAHMTPAIISQVEDLAKSEGMPEGLAMEDGDKVTILDLETDEGEDEDDDSNASDDSYDSKDNDSVMTDLTGVVDDENEPEDDEPHDQNDEEPTNCPEPDPEVTEHPVEPVETQECGEAQPNEGVETQECEDDPAHSHDDSRDHEAASECDNGGDEDQEAAAEPTEDVPNDEIAIDFTGEEGYEINDDEVDVAHPEAPEAPEEEPTERRSLRQSVQRINAKTFKPINHQRNLFTAGLSSAVRRLEQTSEACCFIQKAVDECNNLDASLVTPQCGMEKGLKIFKEEGAAAALKELLQLHNFNAVTPKHAEDMTEAEMKNALPHLMFLKRKRCGKIKGRGCADGRAQREFASRDEASSPAASLHAIILTSIIDAIERRHAVTTDTPGAFLQTEMPEDEDPVHIRFTGSMVDLLERIDPNVCSNCIATTRKGKRILCAKANKAICGTLKAALLFWKKLKDALEDKWGFSQNPHDHCTMNKIMDGTQATIAWHVDDLRISHAKKEVVDSTLSDLDDEFGGQTGLSTTTGKVHDCPGMTVDCSRDSPVMISMCDCLEDIIATMPESLKSKRNCATPAAEHPFEANDAAEKPNEGDADAFHRTVAKLPFAAKRARPDTQTAVAFLCTRVQSPDVDDWKKLARVLGHIKETMFPPLTPGWDETGNIHWHADASFAVHQNMRSHTGAVVTFGKGAAMSMSAKQKLDAKSSTEAEPVGADDALPFNIWCMHFLQAQGFHANQVDEDTDTSKLKCLGHRNILHQDNTSSMRLESNGKASSTKRTRHFNIRLFLIADKVKRKEASDVTHCPTEEMIADALTKPLQGSLFRKFRNAIMGCTDAEYLRSKSEYDERLRQRSESQKTI